MKIKMEEEKNKDDGSLSFLNIPRDKNSRHFNCPEITQQKLTNLTFWVIDYMDGVSTKFGKDRALVMIKENLEDKEVMRRNSLRTPKRSSMFLVR